MIPRARTALLLAACTFVVAAIAGAAPEGGAELVETRGQRVSVFAPERHAAAARRIAEQGDRAVDRYARDLGFEVPRTRFKIFLYPTAAEYEKAEESRTHGVFRTNLAFTYARDAEVHMVLQPRESRVGAPGGPGMLEALALHELSHAVQYRLVPSYDDQPDWLSEGFAEVSAERAVGGTDAGCAERVPWFADLILDARYALERGASLSLEKLLAEGLTGTDGQERQLRYGMSFALVRLLDDPATPERRSRFRAYLREVMALAAGKDLAGKANARFRELFGARPASGGAASLAALERELQGYVRKVAAFPWQIIHRDLRAGEDGSLALESFPRSSAVALSTDVPLGERARISATVTIEDEGGRQADIVVAYRAPNDFHKFAFGSAGYVTFIRYDGAWKTIANAKVAPELLRPGVPHELEVEIDGAQLLAKVDGKLVFRYTHPGGAIGGGRFGVGTYDGRATFAVARGRSL